MKRFVLVGCLVGIVVALILFLVPGENAVNNDSAKIQVQSNNTIPDALKNRFTLNDQIPVTYGAHQGMYADRKVFTTNTYNANIQKALLHQTHGEPDVYLYMALDGIANQLLGKKVALIGSKDGWYESLLLSYGATPVVIVQGVVSTQDPRVTYLSSTDFYRNPQQLEFIFNISSLAKEGLGLGGEPLDPEGDLRAMTKYKEILAPNGKLILAIPIGPDELVWNAYRVYGTLRLKMLFQGWRPVQYYGFLTDKMSTRSNGKYQPIFILEPKRS